MQRLVCSTFFRREQCRLFRTSFFAIQSHNLRGFQNRSFCSKSEQANFTSSHTIQIKFNEEIVNISIPNETYRISNLIKEVESHFNIDETSFDLQIIHGAHPFLTQHSLNLYKTQDRSPIEFLTHQTHQAQIQQPFLEFRQRSDSNNDPHVDNDLYPVINKHLSEYCLHPETLEHIMHHIIPSITTTELQSPEFRRKMKLLYPPLLRFQSVGNSLLSMNEKQLLGRNPSLSHFETAQVFTPLFISFFTNTEPKTLARLTGKTETTKKESWKMQHELAVELASLCQPHKWYSLAREMKRKIILHVGPTNSGKTYSSLEALRNAPSGIYCGPLRLLAQEIYEKFSSEGVPINLLTGQSREIHEDSRHTSCTVEMADLNNFYHCAVIDEIQMITDPDRGWAWTRAVLGIPAKEIHLCGNESSVNIIQEMAKTCGDELEIKRYKRLSPLTVPKEPLETIFDLRKGDCIIAFSRAKIFAIKQQLEKELKTQCCVIYGKLPPETRSQQAKLFNSGDPKYPILIATDAIGMGLNLNIKRIIFSSVVKFNGRQEARLTPAELKQIAGRAGRFKSVFPTGEATAFDYDEQNYIRYSVQSDLQQLPFAGILPNYEQIELFTLGTQPADSVDDRKFSAILEEFTDLATVDNQFFLCGFESILELAKAIDDIDLSLKDRYDFCLAPCNVKNQFVLKYMREYATAYSAISTQFQNSEEEDILPTVKRRKRFLLEPAPEITVKEVPLLISKKMIATAPLEKVEDIYSVLDLYIWLSWRFAAFSEREKAVEIQKECNARIEQGLASQAKTVLKSKKRKRGKWRR